MKTILFACVLAVVGCKKAGPDCQKAIDHSMDLAKDDMKKMGNDDAMLQKMKDVGVQHCKADNWSADVTKCMIDAKSEADGQACYGKLTPEQQQKMNAAAMELAKPAMGSGTEGSAMGSASAGSAMGSAGSAGSAVP